MVAVHTTVASLLLVNQPCSVHRQFKSSLKPFGVRNGVNKSPRRASFLSVGVPVVSEVELDVRNDTNKWGIWQRNGEMAIQSAFESMELVEDISTEELVGSECMENLSDVSLQLTQDAMKKSTSTVSPPTKDDGRHDEIVSSIVNHFRGANVPVHSGGDGGTATIDKGLGPSSPDNRRANVQLPPGWGKTQMALKVVTSSHENGIGVKKGSSVRSVIYVTPRLVLVDQLFDHIDRFGAFNDIPHSRLIVASKTNTTEAITTDPQDIATFLGANADDGLRLLVCTYNSLPKVGEGLSLLKNAWEQMKASLDLAIFDEAHTMEGAGKMTGYGLYDEHLPVEYRLFMTATPQTYAEIPEERVVLGSRLSRDGSNVLVSKRRTDEYGKTTIRSFDNQELFGPCVAKRTFRESVKQNITVPLQLVVFDRAELIATLGDSLEGVSRDELLPFVLQAAFHTLNVTHAVSFHSLVNRAKEFVNGVQRVFGKEISAVSVDGKMSASKRQEMLNQAKQAPSSIVANCRLLAEGVDESEWELVFMADPVRSPNLAQQMIGRVSRVAPGKKKGYVLIPVIFDKYDAAGKIDIYDDGSDAYTWLVAALEAMVAGDPQLGRDIVFVSDESKRIGRPLKSSEYPESLREAFLLPSTMPIELRNSLMERVVVEVGELSSWDRYFELLLAYKGREGHVNVPMRHVENGCNLGVWLRSQRKSKKEGTLDPVRRQHLEEAGMVWDVLQDQWENMYSTLLHYKHREGHCDVPRRHVEGGVNLGAWLCAQRKSKRRGTLDPVRRQRLEEACVAWDPIEEKWHQNFELLLQHKAREGHCDVPQKHKEDGNNLGHWLASQRNMQRMRKLEPFKEERLDEIGVVWDPVEAQWNQSFTLLLQFKEREGHCDVPFNHQVDDKNLGCWLQNQRTLQRNGLLEPFKKQRLEEIGVSWDPVEAQWNQSFALLLQFKEREGHCDVPRNHKEDGNNLGTWLGTQRQLQRKGLLEPFKEQRLEDAKVVWNLLSEQWNRSHVLLLKFKEREGHCDVPLCHEEDNVNLGQWLSNQQKMKRNGKLEKERELLLDEAGVTWSFKKK